MFVQCYNHKVLESTHMANCDERMTSEVVACHGAGKKLVNPAPALSHAPSTTRTHGRGKAVLGLHAGWHQDPAKASMYSGFSYSKPCAFTSPILQMNSKGRWLQDAHHCLLFFCPCAQQVRGSGGGLVTWACRCLASGPPSTYLHAGISPCKSRLLFCFVFFFFLFVFFNPHLKIFFH